MNHTVDFEVLDTLRPTTAEDVADSLRSVSTPIRIAGAGSTQDRVPAPDTAVTIVQLSALQRILRLEPGDMTCSVEPGVLWTDLSEALAEHRLTMGIEQPFGTTVGGVFAGGERAPAGPGQHACRSLILGMRAVLADGTPFKAGAQVVKSVAGFDLQRAFVGSRGRLCIATALHLKVRPKPEAQVHFASGDELSLREGLEHFRRLRRLSAAPASLYLTGTTSGENDGADGRFQVRGTFEGRGRVVAQQLRATELPEAHDARPSMPFDSALALDGTGGSRDWLRGLATARQIEDLVTALPPAAWVCFGGGSSWDAVVEDTQTPAVLRDLDSQKIRAEVLVADSTRRGQSIGTDPRAMTLEADLRRSLDPQRILR